MSAEDKNAVVADVIGNVQKVLQKSLENCESLEYHATRLAGEKESGVTIAVCNRYAISVLKEVALALGIELEEE